MLDTATLRAPVVSLPRRRLRHSPPASADRPTASRLAGKVTQVILPDGGTRNLELLMPLLAQLSLDERWFAWISPPRPMPYSWLLNAGIDPEKLLMLPPRGRYDCLELACKALASGNSHAVISWPEDLEPDHLTRLEKAALQGASHAILLRHRG